MLISLCIMGLPARLQGFIFSVLSCKQRWTRYELTLLRLNRCCLDVKAENISLNFARTYFIWSFLAFIALPVSWRHFIFVIVQQDKRFECVAVSLNSHIQVFRNPPTKSYYILSGSVFNSLHFLKNVIRYHGLQFPK